VSLTVFRFIEKWPLDRFASADFSLPNITSGFSLARDLDAIKTKQVKKRRKRESVFMSIFPVAERGAAM
jgi:hypothetical protein